MKSNKKGQGLSITTVVIAAIALLVLVVLAAIFAGRLGIFSWKTKDCLQVGGTCDQGSECDAELGFRPHPDGICMDADNQPDRSRACCIRAG